MIFGPAEAARVCAHLDGGGGDIGALVSWATYAKLIENDQIKHGAFETGGDDTPQWVVGDAVNLGEIETGLADFVFSCPPYGDLEVYSDNPADLSTMPHDAFMTAYRKIIAAAVGKLKEDRFACFVVGDYRDKQGFYRNFPGETVAAFEMAGAGLYNEAILVTVAGSLPIRAGKQFAATRKLGKTHQNVLVFCKGDPRKATDACGPVEIDEALFADLDDSL